jgi:hypothetical protein
MAKRRKRRGKSMSAYFREVFTQKPEWLEQKSNDVVLARYRSDKGMSAEKPVDKSVKATMANMKSVMRKELRLAAANGSQAKAKLGGGSWSQPTPPAVGTLESLEEMIDECLVAAKSYDRAGLDHVIRHLRSARNQVVWKMGQKD